jgi:hypothetical protein
VPALHFQEQLTLPEEARHARHSGRHGEITTRPEWGRCAGITHRRTMTDQRRLAVSSDRVNCGKALNEIDGLRPRCSDSLSDARCSALPRAFLSSRRVSFGSQYDRTTVAELLSNRLIPNPLRPSTVEPVNVVNTTLVHFDRERP